MTAPQLTISARANLRALAPRSRPTLVASATLVDRVDHTTTLAGFTLRPDVGVLSFSAGQYVQVRLMDDTTPPRPYSIASSPGSRDLDILVSLVDGGALTPRLFRLPLGSRLFVGIPTGRFCLARDDDRDHILVGTGSGVAPLLSMVADLQARPKRPRTILLHGARTPEGLAGRATLDALHGTWFSYLPTLSRPADRLVWTGRTGHVQNHLRTLLATAIRGGDDTVAYICGNTEMIDDCVSLLLEAGVPATSIRTERFAASTSD